MIFGSLLIAGCQSPRTRHEWLTLLFDGVPSKTAGPAAAPFTKAVVIAAVPPLPKPPFEVLHQPYEQQKCGACHDSSTVSTNAKLPLLQLCFNCHKNFLTEPKVKHQPVANGDCLECHAPHKSPNKNLLLQKGDALCLTCHDDPLAVGKVKHQGVKMSSCLDCHSPHATNFKGLLKASVQDTCADCHEEIPGKNKKSVHQPVANGECLECHVPHASDQKFLVKKSTPEMCWDCHDDFREKAKFQHFGVDDCASCHRPHASVEKKLLVKDVLKLCGECHEDNDLKKVKGHSGKAGVACTICHDPHVGTNANLLKPSARPK